MVGVCLGMTSVSSSFWRGWGADSEHTEEDDNSGNMAFCSYSRCILTLC